MNRLACIFLVLITCFSCRERNNANQTENLSNLRESATRDYKAEKFAECAKKAKLLFKEAANQENTELEAFAAHLVAKSLLKLDEIDTAYYYLDQAQRRYLNGIGTQRQLIESYIESAILLNKAEDQAKAERMAFRALKLLQELPSEIKLYCAAYNALSDVYLALGDLTKAERYQKMALNKLKQVSGVLVFENLGRLAHIFIIQDQADQALRYLQSAGEQINRIPLNTDQKLLFYNQLAQCYQILNNPKLGTYYDDASRNLLPGASVANQVAIIVDLSKRSSNFDRLQLLKKANAIAQKAKLKKERLLVYDALANSSISEASRFAAAYVDLSDSLENNAHQMRNQVARITFGNDQLLNEIDAVHAVRKYYIIFGLSVILLLIVVLLVIFERLRNREMLLVIRKNRVNDQVMHLIANQQNEVDQQRMQQKILLANSINKEVLHTLDQVKTQLREQTPEYADDGEFTEIKTIQDVEQQVRTIAHALNGAIFSENISFNNLLEEKVNMLQSSTAVKYFLEVEPTVNWDTCSVNYKIDFYLIFDDILRLIITTLPKNVFITISSDAEVIKLIFLDDGNGSDFNTRKKRSDLQQVLDRISTNNGNYNIKPRPGKGTTIIVTLPLEKISE